MKNFPDHGETLAMKGLLLNSMDKKDEARELVKKGLRMNLRSHVCWHVFGLLYRSERNYPEAIKSYINALRHDKENLQILRDLSLLQVHVRDYDGFQETRATLLRLKGTMKSNWVSLSIAYYLLGQMDAASNILAKYDESEKLGDAKKEKEEKELTAEARFENSEYHIFKMILLEKGGKMDEAKAFLEEHEDVIVDKHFVMEKRAAYALAMDKYDDADKLYLELTDRNPEDTQYFLALADLRVHRSKSASSIQAVYEDLLQRHPNSLALQRLNVDASDETTFPRILDAYCRKMIRKGVTSLFSDLKPLYESDDSHGFGTSTTFRIKTMDTLFESYVANLSAFSRFDATSSSDEKDLAKESPSALLWSLCLLARHHDISGNLPLALTTIERAIEHTPTVPDLYVIKAKILKHGGDLERAAEAADVARVLDTQDRYLNAKCGRYMIRCGKLERAMSILTMFAKDNHNDLGNNLYDMQAMWYELERGNYHLSQQDMPAAIRFFRAIEKHFEDVEEDQFDFHNYCVRKMTLRAYLEALQMEDHLRSHRNFHAAALGILEAYLHLHLNPNSSSENQQALEDQFADLDPAERKKALKKLKKQQMKDEKEREAAAAASAQNQQKADAQSAGKDGGKAEKSRANNPLLRDPEGKEIVEEVKEKGALTLSIPLCQTLLAAHPTSVPALWVCFRLYLQRQKLALALRCWYQLQKVAKSALDQAKVHTAGSMWLKAAGEAKEGLEPVLAAVWSDVAGELVPAGTTPADARKVCENALTNAMIISSPEAVIVLGTWALAQNWQSLDQIRTLWLQAAEKSALSVPQSSPSVNHWISARQFFKQHPDVVAIERKWFPLRT